VVSSGPVAVAVRNGPTRSAAGDVQWNTPEAKPGKRGRKKISAQARARMAAVQKTRRAKEKQEAVVEKPATKPKAKSKVSPALLAALARAREARAAKRKAAKKA
jgi:hypothetical protein